MAVDERKRHEMYLSLEQALGREAADTLMELVPPVGWADVATKHDVQALEAATRHDIKALEAATRKDLKGLEERMELRFQVVDNKFIAMEARMLSTLSDKLRRQTITLATLILGAAGAVIATGPTF